MKSNKTRTTELQNMLHAVQASLAGSPKTQDEWQAIRQQILAAANFATRAWELAPPPKTT